MFGRRSKFFSLCTQVCELDIIFNFHKAYYIMDELFIGGYLQETSKSEVLRICAAMDEMMDDSKDEDKVQGRANSSPRAGGRKWLNSSWGVVGWLELCDG